MVSGLLSRRSVLNYWSVMGKLMIRLLERMFLSRTSSRAPLMLRISSEDMKNAEMNDTIAAT